jgi:hypothetical protein
MSTKLSSGFGLRHHVESEFAMILFSTPGANLSTSTLTVLLS